MSDADVTEIAAQTMMVAAKVAAPILLTALLVGFLISLFQAATQIQEQTLSFVPKMIAVAIALLVTGNWVLSELVSFTQTCSTRCRRCSTGRDAVDLSVPAVTLAALLLGRRGPPASCCWPRRSTRGSSRRRSRARLAMALSLLLSTQIAPSLPEPTAGSWSSRR